MSISLNKDNAEEMARDAGKARFGLRQSLPFLVSFLLLALVFLHLRSSNLFESFGALDPMIFAPLVLLVLLRVFFVSLRWQLLLSALGGRIAFHKALRLTYCGACLNSLLPGSVAGDPYRIYAAAKGSDNGEGMTLSAALAATLLDRFIGLFSLCLLCGLTLPFLAPLLDDAVALSSILAASAATLAIGFVAGVVLLLLDKLIAAHYSGRLAMTLRKLAQDLRAVACRPAALTWILGLSFLGHLSLAALFLIALSSLGVRADEMTGGSAGLLAVAFPATLAQMMPFSLNGWGVRELAAVSGFSLLGVAAPLALTASIAAGAANTIALLPAALLLFKRGKRRDAEPAVGLAEPGA